MLNSPSDQSQNTIEFKEGVPVSKLFDDVYFSKQGGWEESLYVFFNGNDVGTKISESNQSVYRIGELGFGSGLNLFVTLESWNSLQNPNSMEFISLEGYPLNTDILLTLNKSYPNQTLWFEELLTSYEIAKFTWGKDETKNLWTYTWVHQTNKSQFTVNVYFGDIQICLPRFPMINSWYLDGFSPGKNPEMWSPEVLRLIRNKSIAGTSLATFSSAGFLRRNLTELGFVIEKKKGFGRKREMISGLLK
ncbi:S-adenosyl-L-methionine-dependent methyltransferase [Leptospira congkakensis]|uniref:S-adenosyl-L-methionine-dependent methyltransferase n=1 Tax=Leptospira congkakensis TaxID=2484932 RepID=A0A4Z1ADE6_9LEPT|nr:tRNA (5-methylaminomethyl-2-thiouridine)(34)-methyltransferase MnmD [Leptospira congkakensis]TGL87823.1 S-adenosyl-L-methionine-dependent methyltransferase [Leptospira congkakensis]TGL92600.1 S-adenosyl-L-methionine-dependent methyltransferase [Leptospira congkakensis]TGL95974.1 S-adenosyl-L-methionine-dependent methyltransferase [Leptospira congkakensis]